MATKFKQQLTEIRRAHILEAAVAVIAEKGFQNTTIKQIAAKAEVADGTIYNYFKNKDDILLAIVADITEAETRELHFSEVTAVDLSSFTRDYVHHRLAELDAGYPVMKLLIAETLVNPELGQEVYEKVYKPNFAIAERFFDQLIADGQLMATDSALLSRLFAAPLLGLFLLRMMGDTHIGEHWQAYSDALAEGITRFLPTTVQAKANSVAEGPSADEDVATAATKTKVTAKQEKKKRKK